MLKRRLLTIPGYAIAWALWLAAAPVWLMLAAAIDLVRRSGGTTLRSTAVVTVYLTCELIGIIASGGLWAWNLVRPFGTERWTELHFRLEAWWGATLLGAVARLFDLRFEIESDADLELGPYLLLLRHTSVADTLLASALVSRPYGLRLRYVLKRELLWDPCLDIVGNRVPNVFVDRFSEQSAREVDSVKRLAEGLGPRDGILIYPEGTRFSETKRARVLERLREKGDAEALEYARSLTSVLPPRPGGMLGLLEAAPDADVIVGVQTGFEGAASLATVFRGALLHRVIRVQFRRIPRAEIPADPTAQIAWLRAEWQRVDAWVRQHA
jgi:1-acyl-sn-glycerol-3-phosphate acyltransferase